MSRTRQAVILSAVRTPIGRLQGTLSSLPAAQLGAAVVQAAVARTGVSNLEDIDEVLMGNVVSAGLGQNIARQCAIRGGLPTSVGAMTINKVCGASLKAVMLAAQAIRAEDGELFVSGGVESMSHAPHLVEGRLNQRRLWAEGRLKLEPWLAERISKDTIKLFPQSQVTACRELPNGELEVGLNGSTFAVDQIILATGYKVNVSQVPLLASGNILTQLETQNGFPILDEHFQSNIPGLYFTSMCATQDFGPFFAFTAAVRTSARLIGSALNV